MKNQKTIFLLLLLAAILFLIANLIPENQQSGYKNIIEQKDIDHKVNRNLFMTNKNKELEQEKRKIELESLPQIGDKIFSNKEAEIDSQIDFSVDRNETTAADDLDRNPKNYQLYDGPNFKTQEDLTRQEQIEIEKEKYKKDYARQFIENARKNGYEVKLSDDFVVLSVKKIKQSAQPVQVFDPSLSGSN